MKTIKISIFLLFVSVILISSCKKNDVKSEQKTTSGKQSVSQDYKIEFVELGSVNCIPCKKMQPVMASIEKKYAGQVKVTFHDVWKDDAPAKKYGIDLIPTQVFLDAGGKELMRHQGFFPEEDIDKFLQSQGLNISN
ncbi:MAG TPA: thioredoxin family protein [Ignavibacteria bacterium]